MNEYDEKSLIGTIWSILTGENLEEETPEQNNSTVVQNCDHNYVVETVKEATCATAGERKYTCSKCGNSYKETVAATGDHNYVSHVTKEATCTEDGEATYTCSVCGNSYTDTVKATGHSYEATIAEDATCTLPGTRVYICSECDASYTEEIPATGHTESEFMVTKEPGIFTKGEQQITCTTCGEVLASEVIPSKLPTTAILIPILIILMIGTAIARRRIEKADAAVEAVEDIEEIDEIDEIEEELS